MPNLERLGQAIESARSSVDEARTQLTRGKGNLLRQGEMLRDLRVKVSKALRPGWVGAAIDNATLVLTEE